MAITRKMRFEIMLSPLAALVLVLALCILVPSPATPAQGLEKGKWVKPAYYPDRFNGMGTVYRIGRKEIVIDDMLFRFSPFVKFNTQGMMDAPRSAISKGNYVGYILGPEGEVLSIWLLK